MAVLWVNIENWNAGFLDLVTDTWEKLDPHTGNQSQVEACPQNYEPDTFPVILMAAFNAESTCTATKLQKTRKKAYD